MGTDTTSTTSTEPSETTPKVITSVEEATTMDAADWYLLVQRYQRVRSVLLAFATRDDLVGGRVSVDKLVEEIQVGYRHDCRLFGERHPVPPGEFRAGQAYFERPCCSHVEAAEAEVAQLRTELADVRAALALADAALEEFRRPRGRQRMTVAA